MHLTIRPTQVREHLNTAVYSRPGGGKTHFLLSSYWEQIGRTDGPERGGPVVFDAEMGGADDTALDMGLVGKVPIVEVNHMDVIFLAVQQPHKIVAEVQKSFPDYEVDTFGFDTLNSALEVVMGDCARPATELLDAREGHGIMRQTRKRDKAGNPMGGDYKAQNHLARTWFRQARTLPFNTIITCHAGLSETEESPKGMDVPEREKTFEGFPMLPGQLKYSGYKMVDHFFFMEERAGKFITYTRPFGVWNARSRIRRFLDPRYENFTFARLKEIYAQARKENAVAMHD